MCFAVLAGLAGTALSAVGSIAAGNAQSAAAKAQAQLYDQQAKNSFFAGEFDAGKTRDQANQVMGRQIAGYSESGVGLQGSPTNVIGSSASDAALDIGAIKWNAMNTAQKFEYDATLQRQQAKSAQTAGYIGAASSVLGGISRAITLANSSGKTTLGQPYGSYP